MARNEALDRILRPDVKPRRARLFGLSVRSLVIGAVVVVIFFSSTLWALNRFFPEFRCSYGIHRT